VKVTIPRRLKYRVLVALYGCSTRIGVFDAHNGKETVLVIVEIDYKSANAAIKEAIKNANT
jgi:hypothetical protein